MANVAQHVRQHKEQYPEKYCPDRRCLWALSSGPCPRHDKDGKLKP